jgi:prevent-host-death family protein
MTPELVDVINVAEAKRRFSELIERVGHGERIVIARRGTPVMGIVPPNEVGGPAGGVTRRQRVGLAAVAGALSDWDDIDDAVAEIYAQRDRAVDRPAPDPV